jgi:RimJ/RimL family protein N-acetyltransferase
MQFQLRPLLLEDAPALAGYANNAAIASRLTDAFPHPYAEQDAIAFIEMQQKNSPAQVMGIVIDGVASGAIGIHPQGDVFRRNAEMGYWLAEPFWGQGIITKAIQQMVLYGFSHFAIDRIFARPFGSNLASQRVLEKAGFQLEARFKKTLIKNGMLEDECIYAIRKENSGTVTSIQR